MTLNGSDFPVCCAYTFRIRAYKRTTHGCIDPAVHNFHSNWCTFSFTVLRPELCPDICPPCPPLIDIGEPPLLQREEIIPQSPEAERIEKRILTKLDMLKK